MENSLSELSSELGVTPFGLVDTGHFFHTSPAQCIFFYSNLPNNRVGPYNRVGNQLEINKRVGLNKAV